MIGKSRMIRNGGGGPNTYCLVMLLVDCLVGQFVRCITEVQMDDQDASRFNAVDVKNIPTAIFSIRSNETHSGPRSHAPSSCGQTVRQT